MIWLGSWKDRVSLGICAFGVLMIPWWSRSCRAGGYQLQDPQNMLAGIFSLLKYSKYWFLCKLLIFYSILFLSYHPVHFIPFLEASTIGLAVALRWRLWSTRLQVQKTNTNHITNRKTNRCRSRMKNIIFETVKVGCRHIVGVVVKKTFTVIINRFRVHNDSTSTQILLSEIHQEIKLYF